MTLIPASNFEVKAINAKFPFKTPTKEGHLIIEGYGFWDKANNGWVSIGSFCPITNEAIPTRYLRKDVAYSAISGGLYNGYIVVSPSKLRL